MDERDVPLPGDSRVSSTSSAPPHVPTGGEKSAFFHGPNGLRAGWRALIFLLIVATIILAAFTAVQFAVHEFGAHPPPSNQVATLRPGLISLTELANLAVILVASVIVGRIERRRLADYGLVWRKPFPGYFWEGLLWGFLAISGVLLVMFLFHGFRITGIDTSGPALAVSGVEWTLAFLAVGFSEEFTFRGYLQFTLTTGIGFWPAALLMSVLFALSHTSNSGESLLGLVQVAVFGIFACIALQRTGNLWWPIGFHAAWDWGQTFFYGVPDSGLNASHNFLRSEFHGPKWLTGGSTGPEASVFTLVALVLVSVALIYRYPEIRYPDPQALSPRLPAG
jgi:uncharacterized protein